MKTFQCTKCSRYGVVTVTCRESDNSRADNRISHKRSMVLGERCTRIDAWFKDSVISRANGADRRGGRILLLIVVIVCLFSLLSDGSCHVARLRQSVNSWARQANSNIHSDSIVIIEFENVHPFQRIFIVQD